MGLLKAGLKFVGRTLNDKHRDSKKQKNKRLAYNDTSKDIKKGQSKGHYVNGKERYNSHLTQRNKAADDLHNNIDKLISDI